MDKIAKSALRAEAQALRSSTAINRAFNAIGGALLIREVQQMADAWTDYSSRVGLAIKNMDAAPQVMERIYDMAQRTYSALDQTAESFIQNSSTLRELGKSTKGQLDYTEALNNALVVSGAKAQVAASVQDALAKAMAAGALKGDNLNTVIERGGRVAEVIAEELGISTLQLRKMGQEGKITGDVIYNSLTKRLGQLTAEAESMPATISDGFQRMRNALQRWIGTMDQAAGVSGSIAQGMVYVSEKFDSVAHAAAAAGAVLVSRYVPALARVVASQIAVVATNPFLAIVTAISAATFAMSAFGGELQPIADDMANLHDYAGAAFDAIKEGVIGAYDVISDSLLVAINLITDALSGVEVSWGDVWDVVKDVANSIIGAMGLVYDTVVISFTKLPSAIADGVISAMNTMIGFVESGINKVVSAVNTAIKAINSLGEWAGSGSLISEIGGVDLGRLGNEYAGAGEAAGEAFSAAFAKASQDHLGNLGEAWRNAANERARKRAEAESGGAGIDLGGNGGPGRGGAGDTKKGSKKKTADDRFDNLLQGIRDRTEAMRIEAEVTGLAYQEQEKRRMALELEQEALKFVREEARKKGDQDWQNAKLSPEQIAKINEMSEAYAQQAEALRLIEEAQGRAESAAQEFYDTFKSGMIGALKGAESFSDALSKILEKLAEMVLNSAFDSLFNGATGSGGWLTGIFKGLGFSSGGYTGPGPKNKPAGIVHAGEVVWSQDDIRRAGGVAAVEAMRKGMGGMAIPTAIQAPTMPKLSNMVGGGGTINAPVNINIDATGADREGLMRVEQQVAKLRQEVPSMVISNVRKAQKSNVKLG